MLVAQRLEYTCTGIHGTITSFKRHRRREPLCLRIHKRASLPPFVSRSLGNGSGSLKVEVGKRRSRWVVWNKLVHGTEVSIIVPRKNLLVLPVVA